MNATDLANLLAKAGEATSAKGSTSQKGGQAAGELAGEQQNRKFLADMIGGGGMPDIAGRHGLDPQVVLQGLQLRHEIEQSRPEPVQMTEVNTPWGTEVMPAEEAPDFRRKVYNQEQEQPTDVDVFNWYDQQDKETQKKFQELMKSRRGKSFAEIMAEFEAKKRTGRKIEEELDTKYNLGTPEHFDDVRKRFDDADISRRYRKASERYTKAGRPVPSPEQFKEMVYTNEMARDIENEREDLTNVRYDNGPKGVGFYGTRKDGKKVFIKKRDRSR